jgi:tetratricopeptide (TPR) repeat protein
VTYFSRAADVDPSYKIPYRVPVGVLTYLGRAYYETGKDEEARKTLEKAVSLNKDDSLAHLYLGLTLLRTGDRDRGRKEIEGGLKGIHETLEYIASESVKKSYTHARQTFVGMRSFFHERTSCVV